MDLGLIMQEHGWLAVVGGLGLKVLGALAMLVIGWTAASWFRRIVERRLTKSEFDVTLTKFFSNIVRYAVIALAIISSLRLFGVDTTSFAAVLAAAGFAVGLALQGTLSNFSAGVMLLAFRPFKVSDVVNVCGQIGTVAEIELFTTHLDTPDNRRIILPNSQVFGATIENISFHPTRRVDVNVGTDYAADLDRTREVLEAAAAALPDRLHDQEIAVALVELGDSAISWQVRVWVDSANFWPSKQQLTRDVKIALDTAGIGIPFPQMAVHLDKPNAA